MTDPAAAWWTGQPDEVAWFHDWLLDEGYVPDDATVEAFLDTQTGRRRAELHEVCAATDGWQEAADEAFGEYLADLDAERRDFDRERDL